MKTLVQGKTNVKRLLGFQESKHTQYRLMKYVLKVECNEGLLLHNVITGQLVLLDDKESSLLKHEQIDCNKVTIPLIRDYFLVPLDYHEKVTVDQLRVIMRRLFSPRTIDSYTILTTTNCNARCFYCYQYGYEHLNMDYKTADQLVQYIVKHRGPGKVRLHWFGGEPLLGINRIDQICGSLIDKKIPYTSSMISNGFLFTDNIAIRAKDFWNLKKVQITLDGTEDIYNSTKAYMGVNTSPYKRVLRNIQSLTSLGIYISVRLNLDQHNINDIKNVIDDLIDKVGSNEYLSAYVNVLFKDEGEAPITRNQDSELALLLKQIEISKYLEHVGLNHKKHYLPAIETNHCMADGEGSVVVFPDGGLYKCEHTKYGDEFGNVSQNDVNETILLKYKETIEPIWCKNCPLYPSCILLKDCNGKGIDQRRKLCEYNIESFQNSMRFYLNNNLYSGVNVINNCT